MSVLKIRDENGNWKEIDSISGLPGKDGYTPKKGVDYFTEVDINELNSKKIEKYIKLLCFSDTAPIKLFSLGDMYYNTVEQLIYICSEDGAWSEHGTEPKTNVFYINVEKNEIYYWNNGMNSVGGKTPDYDTAPLATIFGYSSLIIPSGYMICDGRELNRIEYSELFNVIGTSYGDGDGNTTFNIPNIMGKNIIGLDENDEDFSQLGNSGGAKTHIQTIEELAKHGHEIKKGGTSGGDGSGLAWSSIEGTNKAGIVEAGQSKPMNIMNPYVVACYIIKVAGTSVLKGNVIDSLDENSPYNAPSQRAVNAKINNLNKYVVEQVLWSNPKPTSIFAPQDVNLSTDDYDYVEWFYYNWTSTEAQLIQSVKVPKGYNFNLSPTILSGDTVHYGSRSAIRIDDTTFKFGEQKGIASINPTKTVIDNTWAVPIRAIGYKSLKIN